MHYKINAKAGVGSIGEKFFCIISQPTAARRRDMLSQWGRLYLKGRVQSNLIVKKAVNESERRQHDDGIQADQIWGAQKRLPTNDSCNQ